MVSPSGLHVLLEIAQDGVVFQEVGEGLGVGDVVDGHEFQVLVVQGGPQDVPPDPTEPVDADADGHARSSCV
jgi:hypothetical protein